MIQRHDDPDPRPWYGYRQKSVQLRMVRHDDTPCAGCSQRWRERDMVRLEGLPYCHHCAVIASRVYANPVPSWLRRGWLWLTGWRRRS